MKGRDSYSREDSASTPNIQEFTSQPTASSWPNKFYQFLSKYSFPEDIENINIGKILLPMISTAAGWIIGEFATHTLSKYIYDSEENDYIFKFLFASALLTASAAHRFTDRQITSSVAMGSETLAIGYLYESTFQSSSIVLREYLPHHYAFISSLGISGIAFPCTAAYLAQKLQELLTKRARAKGAQRSDTTMISSGFTAVANTYFLANYFLAMEASTLSRIFQLGLISDNIFHSDKFLQQFRNLPALMSDVGPAIYKKLSAQQKKIAHDYAHNTREQRVLQFTVHGKNSKNIPRYQLKQGDLVSCDEKFDCNSAPISGEVIAIDHSKPTNFLLSKKFTVNLKAHNGEDSWIEYKTQNTLHNSTHHIDLHAIHHGKQPAILTGSKVNFFGEKDFYIQVKQEKEHTHVHDYEKKSIINQIVSDHKQKCVLYSVLFSTLTAGLMSSNLSQFPLISVQILFKLFQTLIPFSETFLRDVVNNRLMNSLNQSLKHQPLETIDALRIVDLYHTLSGYYQDKYKRGIAIVSDKTGTLTTTKMQVLGIWTTSMPRDLQGFVNDDKCELAPDQVSQEMCYEIFASAYTHNSKETEPEEHAMLKLFDRLMPDRCSLIIDTLAHNHFRKTLGNFSFESRHLGLYRSLGGRLTLVSQNDRYYLVFCGIPHSENFKNTPLSNAYYTMQPRTGVLSRDWCIARCEIHADIFMELKNLFEDDNQSVIEKYILSHPTLLQQLQHYGTFLIDNPLKKSAEKFTSLCRHSKIPVFIATGDTAKAAANIAKILTPDTAHQIITLRHPDKIDLTINASSPASTIIFAGIQSDTLKVFDTLLEIPIQSRPVILFAEMSTEGKGILTQYLKKKGFFVVANGDSTNDIAMMKNADVVFTHLNEEGKYSPGVAQFTNINDRQLQQLLHSEQSFYELFDIHKPQSSFIRLFKPLANSQEKPSISLLIKSSKMTFDLAAGLGIPNVKEMWQQHWFTVLFDLAWLGITYYEVQSTTDYRPDHHPLTQSSLPTRCMLAAMTVAALQAFATYYFSGESTNLTWMMGMLTLLPLLLRNIFTGVEPEEQQTATHVNFVAHRRTIE